MAESSQEGCPAKSVRRGNLAEAPYLLYANYLHQRLRINRQSSAHG
jgi:hypothetical protein